MSAPVDVLAVLDYEIHVIPLSTEDFGPQREQDVRDLRDARAALAELIEADRQIADRARRKAGGGWWMISNEDMSALRAALARVKGGAA